MLSLKKHAVEISGDNQLRWRNEKTAGSIAEFQHAMRTHFNAFFNGQKCIYVAVIMFCCI